MTTAVDGAPTPPGRDRGHAHAGHTHAGPTHAMSPGADRRLLGRALALIVAFMLAEVVVGLVAHSLALVADAGHMLSDAAAIALALVAMRLAARPARGSYTYGLKRVEILSAQANGVTLLLLAVLFVVQGVQRLVHPQDVRGGLVLAVALAGVVVNLAAAWLLSRANRQSLNVEGAFRHILTDLYAFIATAVAATVILAGGSPRADAVATLVVAALMVKAGYTLVRDSGRVFLEAAPRGVDPAVVEAAILGSPGVLEVHELHVWEVTSSFPALSAHVLVETACDCHASRIALEAVLADRFGIEHTTLQVDHREDLLRVTGGPHGGHAAALGATGDHAHDAGHCR